MSGRSKTFCLIVLLIFAAADANAQSANTATQVALETGTGWGPIKTPDGFKALRIQGRSTASVATLARLFGSFSTHASMFPDVVSGVQILSCDESTLRARYRTSFDPKPGGKTNVESLTTVRVTVIGDDRVEFTWASDEVKSNYVNAARGRALFLSRPTATGRETLIDYVSMVHPRSSAKGVLVESQKGVLAGDARYVIERLIALAGQNSASSSAPLSAGKLFSCAASN